MTAIDHTPATREPDERIGRRVLANLSTAELYERALREREGIVAADGPLVVNTGKHTGRSPKDKFIVREPSTEDRVWWGDVNRPIDETHYDGLRARLLEHLRSRDVYAQDCHIGAHPAHRRSLRVYTETAWASVFARNLPAAERRAAPRVPAELHDHLRAVVPGRSRS